MSQHLSAWAAHAGLRLRYVVHGAGTPAVLIHELGGSLHSWDGVVAGLGGALQLVRYDQRGHGESSTVRAPYALADHADDLQAVVAQAGITGPCWLIAAAAGAAIAVEFALRHSGSDSASRGGSVMVAGIVMCAPALEVDPARRDYLRERADAVTRNGMSAIVDSTLAQSWPAMLRGDTARFERYRQRLLDCDPLSYAFANRALSDIDLSTRLSTLSCPCLFLAGEHDLQRPPARVASQAALVGHASFAVLPTGHLMAVQSPAEVAARTAAFIAGSRP